MEKLCKSKGLELSHNNPFFSDPTSEKLLKNHDNQPPTKTTQHTKEDFKENLSELSEFNHEK
jgi:hypothetical protein